MNRSTLFIVAVAVLAFHGLAFWAFRNMKPLPQRGYIPPPNFIAKEAEIVDPETGEKTIYREFTVSTKLAEPPAQKIP